MAGCVATVTALLLLVITRASGDGPPSFFPGASAPVLPQFYVYDTQLVAAPVAAEPGRSGVPLPCPSAGFYGHPTNCSRFYRCVDYGGTGQYFSRYEFQCPVGQMFLSVGKDTCVPGDCAGVVAVPVGPSASATDNYGQGGAVVPPGSGPVGDDPGSNQQPGTSQPIDNSVGEAYPQPGNSLPSGPAEGGVPSTQVPATEVTPSTAYPQSGADTGGPVTATYPQQGAASGGATPSATPVDAKPVTAATPPPVVYPQPVTPAPPSHGCQARYVQDPLYCNIYLRCPDDGKRYVCIASTVFDQARQMCRIDDQEDVCVGKQKYSPSPAFRADFPLLNQGGPAQLVGEQTFPSFSQGQSLPLFSQGQSFPSFSQGEYLPLISQGQSFPSFDQGQTFQSFDQVQNFPASQRLVYSAQVPSYIEVSGVPQFAAPDFVSGQDTSYYAQPSYAIPNYFVSGK